MVELWIAELWALQMAFMSHPPSTLENPVGPYDVLLTISNISKEVQDVFATTKNPWNKKGETCNVMFL